MIKTAATTVILRQARNGPETLMVRRNPRLKTNAGAWVFPGGRLDDADWADAADETAAARQAAIRETAEETGLALESDQLEPFAHWTTPAGYPRRYATWFFLTAVDGDNHPITVDGSEIVDYQWLSPASALQWHRDGQLLITPPTFVSLIDLARFDSITKALAAFRQQPIWRFNPKPVATDDGRVILYDRDAGYESEDVHAPGNRHRLIMLGNQWDYQFSIDE